jgi:excisionase family DNA binding protein
MDPLTVFLNNARQFLSEIVDDALAQHDAKKIKPTQEPKDYFMDLEELQNYLPSHPPLPTIYGWCSKKMIPYHKIGRRLAFRRSEIEGWLEMKHVPTTEEICAVPIPSLKRKRYGK